MQDDDEEFVELSASERDVLKTILQDFLLLQNSRKPSGKRIHSYMKQRKIWINQRDFLVKHARPKIVKSLYEKKVIQKHPIVGYVLGIKEMYLEQIFDLLNNEDWDLVLQLAGVWVDCGK